MATKTLQIKRVFAWTIYDNLRKIAPKDYPTTAEIKATLSDILPALKPMSEKYASVLKRAEETQEKIISKEITEEAAKKIVEDLNKEWKGYNKVEGIEIVDIQMPEEGIKTLKAQFERENWGKRWIGNIEEFGELMAAFEAVK
jgi:hypothetical protein